jgi:glycosyltransferase involved in cell wall biosynthesis
MVKAGNHVSLFCQEPHPEEMDFINQVINFRENNETYDVEFVRQTPYKGVCTMYRGNIGKVLPVYTRGECEHFTVKEFIELTDEELENYIEKNCRALRTVLERDDDCAVLGNHVVLAPYILQKVLKDTKRPYYITVHGSGIRNVVLKDSRYLHYAAEGLQGAQKIIVPAPQIEKLVKDVFAGLVPDLEEKIEMIHPGVDPEVFSIPPEAVEDNIQRFYLDLYELFGIKCKGMKQPK